MTAHLQDVRLTERYEQSQLPDEARVETKLRFHLRGVCGTADGSTSFSQMDFRYGHRTDTDKMDGSVAEKISTASNFDSFPPFHVQSSRVSQSLLVTGPQGWHAVSFRVRELDAAVATDSTRENGDDNQLELSPSHLEHTSCERIRGCVVAASVAQRERSGQTFWSLLASSRRPPR